MTIEKIKNGTTLELKVAGRLDTMTYPQLDEVIKNEIGGITELIIDFKALDYISSAGLRVLLSAQKIMNVQGKMTVRNVNETVKEIFEVTGFTDILTIE